MILRDERPEDRASVLDINRKAFGGEEEVRLIEALARDGDIVLSLVAEEEGGILGHILMSRLALTVDGRDVRALALAPMAVVPDMQRRGIGSALVREALARAGSLGFQAVIVLGHKAYYPRFGFDHGCVAKIASPYTQYEEFMGLELASGVLTGKPGSCRYARAFSALD
ncbi:MAG: N-acetyltransferase [Alphaproteobacteria bacterium]|nr:N-acetyltransferase [Alphaproteobacteria bacterium]